MPRSPDDVRSPEDFERRESVDTSFFRRQSRHVARDLVGTLLVNDTDEGRVGGIVVEVEAYIDGLDPACHLSAGRTPRTETFFSGPGTVYVFTIYGHHNLNVITAFENHPGGVLIRAIEPTHGLDVMRERRGMDDPALLTSGPGRLTEALGVTRTEYDDRPLAASSLSIFHTDIDPAVRATSRIGVTAAEDWPLRYVAADSDCLSGPVSEDEDLAYEAIDRCYEILRRNGEDLPTLDDPTLNDSTLDDSSEGRPE